mgnify:CR=1 FL=1
MKTKTFGLSLTAFLFLVGCSAPGTQERRGTEIGTAGAAAGAAKDREQDRRYERGAVRAQPRVDEFGYTLDDYIALMTADEMEILQARAQARPEVQMGVLLTDQEKANLRRRSVGNQEIGR